jgi:hypothetical protein
MNLLSKIEYTSVSELEYNHLPLEKLPFRRLTFSVHNVNFMNLKLAPQALHGSRQNQILRQAKNA